MSRLRLPLTLLATCMLAGSPAFAAQEQSGPVTAEDPAPAVSDLPRITAGKPGDLRLSKMIGAEVYASKEPLASRSRVEEDRLEQVGDVEDVLIAPDGKVEAVLLSIGGFMDIGDRTVAVPASALRVVFINGQVDGKFVLHGTAEQIMDLPAVKREEDDGLLIE